jgi:hypothetical protein
MGSCKHGNEPLGPIKGGGEFLDKLSKYQLQTKQFSIQSFSYLYNFNVNQSVRTSIFQAMHVLTVS